MIPVKIGTPQSHDGLTLFPLFPADDRAGSQPPWTLLSDALEDGSLEVTEVNENGVVGELVAINRGPAPVLILDGEQLIGAKQNRTTSRTILVAASGRTAIPVSCMEQGRWRRRSRSMRHGGEHSPSSVRRHARRVEAREAVASRDREAEAGGYGEPEARRHREPEARRRRRASPSELLSTAQGAVWHSVAESSHRAGVRSDTGALDDVYAERRGSLEERAARFPTEPGQVGVLAFLYGAPVGLDLLPGHAIYARVHDRLVRAYLFESLDAAAGRPHDDDAGRSPDDDAAATTSPDAEREAAESFLAAATAARRTPMETVGLGAYSAVAGPDLFGAELALDGDVVHLSAFTSSES